MEDQVREINEIIESVSAEWRDNRGGLTWAGSDVIRLGSFALADIESAQEWTPDERRRSCLKWDDTARAASTGAEADIAWAVVTALQP